NVIGGGMRAITVVQAFQYWLKLFAISIPAFVLSAVFLDGGQPRPSGALGSPAPPAFAADTTVNIQTDVRLKVNTTTSVQVWDPGAANARVVVWPAGASESVATGTKLKFPEGTPVPVVSDATPVNADWLRTGAGGLGDMLQTYSLILATFRGTMGLPH